MTHLTRASIVLLGLTTLTTTAAAEPTVRETIVHDTTTATEITLSETTVLCSAADYSGLFLKVGIPQLAALTLLDHQNIGAGAPCVAAGVCEPGNEPSDILDAAHPTETVNIRVKAVRIEEVDPAAETCTTTLLERVDVTIRGIAFQHERYASLGSRPYADCVTVAPVAPKTDGPESTPASVEEPSTGGGCDAGSGGTGAGLVLMLGALGVRRRTRR